MQKTNAFVEFLRTYGPSAASKAMYDEHVLASAQENGVDPIHVESPLVGNLATELSGSDPRSVILTGTAGDGKTWHCRQVFLRLGGTAAEWDAAEGAVSLVLPSGKSLEVIKDLSEFHEDPRQEGILAGVLTSMGGHDPRRIYMIAANDGQLLRAFRTHAGRTKNAEARDAEAALRTMLNGDKHEHPSLRLVMHNLSRRPQDDLFDRLVDAVARHPGWKDGETCPSRHPERCPIRRNLRILSETTMRDRLRDLIRIAAANGMHLPMRHLMILIVNVILGVSGQRKTALMTCRLSGQLVDDDDAWRSNPYDNALGLNLKLDGSRDYLAFAVLRSAGIGQETNNAIDNLLIEGQPKSMHSRYVASDTEHGATRFEESRAQYRRGEGEGYKEFQLALEAQRRRLFFVLPPDPNGGDFDPWRLSVFMHGGQYVEFVEALKRGLSTGRTVSRIVVGLNRSYSGVMCDDADKVWFTAPAANTQSRVGRVLDIDLPTGDSLRHMVSVRFGLGHSDLPHIAIATRERLAGEVEEIERNPLPPLLFEYLMRVQGGSLPGSFSRQCFEELRQFRMRVVAKLGHRGLLNLDDVAQMTLVKLGSDGRLQGDEIGVHAGSV